MSSGRRFSDSISCFYSTKKKTKEFAPAVDRAEIEHFAAAIGVTLDDHLGNVLTAMKAIADDLELRGETAK